MMLESNGVDSSDGDGFSIVFAANIYGVGDRYFRYNPFTDEVNSVNLINTSSKTIVIDS